MVVGVAEIGVAVGETEGTPVGIDEGDDVGIIVGLKV